MHLVTDCLELREMVGDDWPRIWRYTDNLEFRRQLLPGMATESGVRRQVESAIREQSARRRQFYYLAVILREGGNLVGSVGLSLTSRSRAVIGWDCDPCYHNLGYATEAAKSMIGYGFGVLHLREIRAACFAENAASMRVMEKLGMSRLERNLLQRCSDHISYRSWRAKVVYRLLSSER